MPGQQSVINLDPIDRGRKKQKGLIGRFLVTRWSGGKLAIKGEPYGHYMFCGPQGASKTASSLWYAEKLTRRYKRRRIRHYDHSTKKWIKFNRPPAVKLYSNIGIGQVIEKKKIFETVDAFDAYANEIRIVLIDEIQSYFPRGSVDKATAALRDDLISLFSQLRKRNTYILSTAQVYGRLDKSLREQCLYMVNCRVNIRGRLVNEFIPGDDIICDELGRWAGDPKRIYVHGLSKIKYDTKRIIRE